MEKDTDNLDKQNKFNIMMLSGLVLRVNITNFQVIGISISRL